MTQDSSAGQGQELKAHSKIRDAIANVQTHKDWTVQDILKFEKCEAQRELQKQKKVGDSNAIQYWTGRLKQCERLHSLFGFHRKSNELTKVPISSFFTGNRRPTATPAEERDHTAMKARITGLACMIVKGVPQGELNREQFQAATQEVEEAIETFLAMYYRPTAAPAEEGERVDLEALAEETAAHFAQDANGSADPYYKGRILTALHRACASHQAQVTGEEREAAFKELLDAALDCIASNRVVAHLDPATARAILALKAGKKEDK